MKRIFVLLLGGLLFISLGLYGVEDNLKLINDLAKKEHRTEADLKLIREIFEREAEIQFIRSVVQKVSPDGVVDYIKDVVMKKEGRRKGALAEALKAGKYPFVTEFLGSVDERGRTVLHIAVSSGEIEIVRALVDMGADINARDKEGRTALYVAAIWEKIEIVRALVDMGADINARDKDGRTVLHKVSALRGSSEIARILIESGIDVNARDMEGKTALHILLSADGEEFQRVTNRKGFHEREVELIELLIGRGVDWGVRDNGGMTLLHEAAMSGNCDVVKVLVGKGLDVNAVDKEGRTALHLAVTVDTGEGLKMSKILVEAGASVDIRDNRGWSVLEEAASLCSDQKKLMRFFIDKGADVNAKDNKGRTALYEAIRFWRVWGMEVLIEAGADINDQDREGRTPLHEAVEACNDSFEESVRRDGWRYGVNEKNGVIDVVGRKRMWKKKYKPCETVKSLIEKGADLNVKDNNGRVPLFELDETLREEFEDEIRNNEIKYEESKRLKAYALSTIGRVVNGIENCYNYVFGS